MPLLIAACLAPPVGACPFCTTIKPTFSQERETAAALVLGEVDRGNPRQVLVRQVIHGADCVKVNDVVSPADSKFAAGALVLLLAEKRSMQDRESLVWRGMVVSEASSAYFIRAPQTRQPAAERLKYFARYIAHDDPSVAEDAHAEFAVADYAAVVAVADALPLAKFREWLVDPTVPGSRKGFYGLTLGLATDTFARRENIALLKQLAHAPADDFRAGFDGVLGGLLVAIGDEGLKLIEQRLLRDPRAAEGDVRHAMTALRFYHDYGQGIARERLGDAMAVLLDRPEFTAAALVDLARWRDERHLAKAAGLYDRPEHSSAPTRRAIIGYLLNCRDPAARLALDALRTKDPTGVANAEQYIEQTGGVR